MDKHQTTGYLIVALLIVVIALFVTSLFRGSNRQAKRDIPQQTTPEAASVSQQAKPPQERSGKQVWEGIM